MKERRRIPERNVRNIPHFLENIYSLFLCLFSQTISLGNYVFSILIRYSRIKGLVLAVSNPINDLLY